MADHSPFQMDVTSDELDLIERWSSMAGCRTKQELLLSAFTLFEWAAKQVMLGRKICAMNEATGEIRHLELPALTAIADWGAPPILTQEEIRRRIAEPGFPFSESDFGFGAEGIDHPASSHHRDHLGSLVNGSHCKDNRHPDV
jgi:hypothetical protein